MKTSSAKAKSRRLQNFVAGLFLGLGQSSGLSPKDLFPRQMGGAGVDTVMSPAAEALFALDIECKNSERLNIVAEYNTHARKYEATKNTPILVHSKNNSKILVTLSFEDFVTLVFVSPEHRAQFPYVWRTAYAHRESWEAIVSAFFPEEKADVIT